MWSFGWGPQEAMSYFQEEMAHLFDAPVVFNFFLCEVHHFLPIYSSPLSTALPFLDCLKLSISSHCWCPCLCSGRPPKSLKRRQRDVMAKNIGFELD